jgi:type I restriction enzyme M protein
MTTATVSELSNVCWSVADLLRGDLKQHQYGGVILPFTVLRRLDCVLEGTKPAVIAKASELEASGITNVEPVLRRSSKLAFYNTCPLDFPGLLADADNLAQNLRNYINGFSPGAVDVLEKYNFDATISLLEERDLLYKVLGTMASVDLHPDRVPNDVMGYVFEDLIRRFAEVSNETAGEHFTPREVIRLMVNLLFVEDGDVLTQPGIVRTMYDPAAGTGGMLSTADEYVRELNPKARLELFGQELNAESYAICRSDMLMKGLDASRIAYGNSLTDEDGHPDRRFAYQLANPPFGVDWNKYAEKIKAEHARGDQGRYEPGLPRVTDGSLLFLMHMISKMAPIDIGGGRLATVFNGSPLFAGAAGGGESDIRRWVIENDLLEGIVALPDQLFYNTGISTYFWVLSNRKRPELAGKVILVDARGQWEKMPKSLGDKRKRLSEANIATVTSWYTDAVDIATAGDKHPDADKVKVVDGTSFGYLRIPIERPLRTRYEVTAEGIAALGADPKFTSRIEQPWLERILVAAESLVGKRTLVENEFVTWIAEAFNNAGPWLAESLNMDQVTTGEVGGVEVPVMTGWTDSPSAIRKQVVAAFTLRDPEAPVVTDAKGRAIADGDLKDFENVPLGEDVEEYVAREVLPHVPDAWTDIPKAKVGYEIPFTRLFFKPTVLRTLEEVDADLKAAEAELHRLLARVTEA